MMGGLDLAAVGRNENGCRSCLLQGLARLGEFAFLKEVSGEYGNAEISQALRVHTIPPVWALFRMRIRALGFLIFIGGIGILYSRSAKLGRLAEPAR